MKRRLWAVRGNSQRLDGGAMFGNVPKALWSRWAPPDEKNRISLACRAMLIEEGPIEENSVEEASGGGGKRRILFETGIGAFFPPKLRDRFGVEEEEHVLLAELERLGAPHDRIDVVVLSHLHFDHAGGLLAAYEEGAPPRLLFPRARFVVSAEAFARAKAPHARDRASFIPELVGLLEQSGRLEVVEGERSEVLGPGYLLHRSEGHTPGLMLAEVASEEGPVVFAADLIPGRPWVHLPITMGYDRYPERLIDEKEALLGALIGRRGRLFFTHDPEVAMGRLCRDDHGRYGVEEPLAAPEGLEI